MVKVIGAPKPSRTSKRLVEFINPARSSKAGKVLAAQKLQSRNTLLIADRQETKNLMEEEDGWKKVITGSTKVRGGQFTVMAHAVQTNRTSTSN
jgi:hypothetical protein